MKIRFEKKENGEFTASVLTSTGVQDFNYIDMIKALLNKGNVEIEFSNNIDENEKCQINEIIEKIKTLTSQTYEKQAEVNEQF